MLRFDDGMNVNVTGPLRVLRARDGFYVAGEGMLIPCYDRADAVREIQRIEGKGLTPEDRWDSIVP
jgi:hypothetical protein